MNEVVLYVQIQNDLSDITGGKKQRYRKLYSVLPQGEKKKRRIDYIHLSTYA